MAVSKCARLKTLEKCEFQQEYIAQRWKLPPTFLVESDRVLINTGSDYSNGAFAKVIPAFYGGAEVRVKRIHAINTFSFILSNSLLQHLVNIPLF